MDRWKTRREKLEANEVSILIVFSIVSIVSAYSFYPFLWAGAFYHLTAFCFVTLTRICWKLTSGSWSLVCLVMHVTALNNLIDELFFDPKLIDYNEYITALITILIILKHRKKWGQ